MTVEKIDLKHQRNEEHFSLMTDTLALIKTSGEAVQTALAPCLNDFAAAIEREDRAVEQIRKSDLTAGIADLDAERDNLYQAIRLKIQAYSLSNIEAETAAAADLQTVTDHYGDIRQKSYNEESGLIHNFVQDMLARPESVSALQLNTWLTALQTAGSSVKELMAQRNDSRATANTEELRSVRLATDTLYKKAVAIIEASVVLHGEADYADFVNKHNQRIAYYKTTQTRRRAKFKVGSELAVK